MKSHTTRRAILAGAAGKPRKAQQEVVARNAERMRTAVAARITAEFEKSAAGIRRRTGAVALRVKGDCCAPRACDGQTVTIDPLLPEPGELVVFWIKGQPMPGMKILSKPIFDYPPHPESEVVHLLEVEQLNPPRRYRIPLDQVECIGRVHSVA
jgi:hypothetical protein